MSGRFEAAQRTLDRSGFVNRPLGGGNMVGSTTRLPLSSTIFGRRWCLPNVPQTRLI